MYSTEDILRALENPKLIPREFNRLYYTNGRTRIGNPDGINFFEQDWDILIILDSCRFDYFKRFCDYLPGTLECKESKASATSEWLETNIRGRAYHDTVYVSANPKLYNSSIPEQTFHDRIYTWQETDAEITDEVSIHPKTVRDLTKEASEEYANKRIVAHFMQPHCPFLGPLGRERFPETSWKEISEEWPENKELLEEVYAENLEYVIPYVESVLDSVDGKVIVTADHGQLLGERTYPIPIREFAHPAGIYVPELIRIPWHVRNSSNRRNIVSDSPVQSDASDDGENRDVEELLSRLGYRE